MQTINELYLRDVANNLNHIAEEIENLIQEAARVLKNDSITSDVWERARGQWYANIASSVHNRSGFMGGPMVKMTDTIKVLRELADEEVDEPAAALW
jgi:hypothetical protein